MFGGDGQFEGAVYTGCQLADLPPAMDLETALNLLEAACQPAEKRRLEHAMAELSLLCKSRPEETEDVAARIAIFVQRLAVYPADVALEAIKRWGNSERWFPSWAELRMKCDRLGSKRMQVRDALCKASGEGLAA